MAAARLPVLDKFIGDLRAIWSAEPENQRRMERAKAVLETFVMEPSLKAHSATWPSTEGYKNLLLYVDPEHNFVINAVVRMPGRTGSVHDHADAWVLYGMLDGTESLERYDRVDDGSRPGYAEVKLASVTTGTQGKVDLVPPHAIHAEQGGPTRSVAIIVRSQKLGQGTVLQRRYDPKTNSVAEQYGPTQVPYDLVA
jgi:predicted metal-dependent enzyme (double-stranded beta helix superfamily)